MPKAPEFPYAVRVVSDILESNGSSSQASICGGCLALMEAGVQNSKPVAGVAMGLITDEKNPNGRYAILTDILGDEDHLGDMDFKVAGTKDGITATQMDIKVDGLSYEVLAKALQQAHEGRMHIMGEMMKCIDKPREDYKPFVPRIKSFEIDKDFIGAVIGKGGAKPSQRLRQRPELSSPSTRLTARVLWTSPRTMLKPCRKLTTGSRASARLRSARPTMERLSLSLSSAAFVRFPPWQGRPSPRVRNRLEQDRECRGCPYSWSGS